MGYARSRRGHLTHFNSCFETPKKFEREDEELALMERRRELEVDSEI